MTDSVHVRTVRRVAEDLFDGQIQDVEDVRAFDSRVSSATVLLEMSLPDDIKDFERRNTFTMGRLEEFLRAGYVAVSVSPRMVWFASIEDVFEVEVTV